LLALESIGKRSNKCNYGYVEQSTHDEALQVVAENSPLICDFTVVVSAVGNFGRLVVDDEGSGLPLDYTPNRGASSSGSTGLGLDIVRRIIESARGTFSVHPRASGGTRAEVLLPPLNAQRTLRGALLVEVV
jgi:signal transduction histidine kinase